MAKASTLLVVIRTRIFVETARLRFRENFGWGHAYRDEKYAKSLREDKGYRKDAVEKQDQASFRPVFRFQIGLLRPPSEVETEVKNAMQQIAGLRMTDLTHR